MRIVRRTRHVLLSATLVIAAPQALIGCQEDPSPKTPAPVQPSPESVSPKKKTVSEQIPTPKSIIKACAKQKANSDEHGYCLAKRASALKTVENIDELCPKAGKWEQECRHNWVSGKMQPNSGFETDDLLKACGDNADCTYELIDFRPNPDILIQIEYCEQYTKKHVRDCVGHAMQRWWYTQPGKEELKRILKRPTPAPDRVGYYAAAVVQCSNKGSCAGETTLMNICQKNARYFKENPEKCPRREELKINSNFKPSDYMPKVGTGTSRKPPNPTGKQKLGLPSSFKTEKPPSDSSRKSAPPSFQNSIRGSLSTNWREENPGDNGCESIDSSLKRDRCYSDSLKSLNGKQIAQTIETAKKINDPIIRGAAISGWVKAHLNEINQREGQKLCALLDGRDMSYCQRRLSSPHLKR